MSARIDPEAVKYLENFEYLSTDTYYSQRKDDIRGLLENLEALPLAEHLPTKAVAFLFGLSAMGHQRFAWVEHRSSKPDETITEKAKLLLQISKRGEIEKQLGITQPKIQPLKTITLQIKKGGPYYFLVSGLGDFRIDRRAKKALEPAVQKALGVEGNVMNGSININPLEEFPPAVNLGLEPGIISPFADLARFGGDQKLKGLLYYRSKNTGYAAIAASKTTTLIVHHSVLPSALLQWQGFYLNIPISAVDGAEGRLD